MPPPSLRPHNWPDQVLAFFRSLSPDQVDAMSRAAPDSRAQFLELWRSARLPTRDEYDAHLRATEGKEALQSIFNWLTTPDEPKKLGVRVGVRSGYG